MNRDPDKWVNDAITQAPKAPPSVSWWLNSKSREDFDAKVRAEQSRMNCSKFGA